MFDGTSLLAAWFCSASNAAHAAFTGLFSLRRLYLSQLNFHLARHGSILFLRPPAYWAGLRFGIASRISAAVFLDDLAEEYHALAIDQESRRVPK